MSITYGGLAILCLILGVITVNPFLLLGALILWFLSLRNRGDIVTIKKSP